MKPREWYVRVWRGDVGTALMFWGFVKARSAAEAVSIVFSDVGLESLRNLDGSRPKLAEFARPELAAVEPFSTCVESVPRTPLFTSFNLSQAPAGSELERYVS